MVSMLPDIQAGADERGIFINEVGISGLRYPVTFSDGEVTQAGVATFGMTVALPADQRGTHMSRMVQAIENFLTVVDPRELHTAFKSAAKLLAASDIRITLELPVGTRVVSPSTGSGVYQVHDVRLSGRLFDDEFSLRTTVTTDVTTLCPCSKAISDYGAHNQRSSVALSVFGEADDSYPVRIARLVQLIRDSSSCPVYPVVKRPDERAITMAAYDNPKFVEDLIRDLSLSCRELGISHEILVRNIESIHSHDAVARLGWIPPREP